MLIIAHSKYMILMYSNWGTNGLFNMVTVPPGELVVTSSDFDYWWDVSGNMMEHYPMGIWSIKTPQSAM